MTAIEQPAFPVGSPATATAQLACSLSDEGGHPVVQLHGLTSSRRVDSLLDLDLGRGLSGTRLLRYDARGHGTSTGRKVPQDYAWPQLADDLLQLLDAYFPGERVHGVGPSMGAATLLHAAVRDPQRFAGLTLLVPPTAWATRTAKSQDYRTAATLIEKRGVGTFVAASAAVARPPATVGSPATEPDVPEGLLPSVFRGAAVSDLPAAADIAQIHCPVTILAWIGDPAHPVSTAEALAQLLPHAVLHVARTPADVRGWPAMLRNDVAAHGRSRLAEGS
ncbi:alpha/beta fold hydrolase [Zhihengliuella flava]|uniref:Pimeloyl-ACP methyl ester carboxylesterase n=1 Tax=Zhihengliuella flava TaxID=1285193 RepID=A0A931GFR1_9MICC|nr:alpha/beta hydrolase [Zhihengliuella flava]MBG6085520.1 pimeloyl-ACP methyl ester carboxylesterase [Zhihengliuella flava]